MDKKILLLKNFNKKISLMVMFTALVSFGSFGVNTAAGAEVIPKDFKTSQDMETNALKDTVSYLGLVLNKTTDNLNIGGTDSLYATAYPSNLGNGDVTWASSNSSVVKVSSNGDITAVAAGIATITATSGGCTASCVVTVINPISVTLVTLSKTTDNLEEGDNDSLYATVYPGNATYNSITWTSSNSDVAKVSSNGYVTAVGAGNATITAAAGGKSASCILTVTRPDVTSVSLSKTTDTLTEGQSETLYATVYPFHAAIWTSSNSDVAKVSADGSVTAVSPGKATITAASGDKSAACTITVQNINSVTLILLGKTTDTLKVGSSDSLYASVYPSNAADSSVVWTSSNPDVAKVSADGYVTAVSAGTAVITATAGDESASCAVTVKNPVPVTWISLNKAADTLEEGHDSYLHATVYPDNADNKDVIWTSSNPDAVKVSPNGYLTAAGVGTATITATAGSKSAYCVITVVAGNPILVKSISLNKTTETLKVGDISSLHAFIYPRDAENRAVTWTSSNPDVAKVSYSGYVTAVSAGTATITATAGGMTATYNVVVTQ